MLTTDKVTSRYVTSEQAKQITDEWNPVYPAVRQHLTDLMKAGTDAIAHPSRTDGQLNLRHLRLALGQLDRGTFKACTRSPGWFSVTGADWVLRDVLHTLPDGHPLRDAVTRLRGVLKAVDSAVNEAREGDPEWQKLTQNAS